MEKRSLHSFVRGTLFQIWKVQVFRTDDDADLAGTLRSIGRKDAAHEVPPEKIPLELIPISWKPLELTLFYLVLL